jgi:hypothetical protein
MTLRTRSAASASKLTITSPPSTGAPVGRIDDPHHRRQSLHYWLRSRLGIARLSVGAGEALSTSSSSSTRSITSGRWKRSRKREAE